MSTGESPEQKVADIAAGQSPLVPPEAGSGSDRASDKPSRPRRPGKLERPGPRANLLRQLARGEKTQTQLAEIYDVAQSSIAEFAQRHKEEIEARRNQEYSALDNVWIANKEARLLELSQLYQHLEDGDVEPDVVRAAKDLLRAAAEELGQIPNKTTVVQAQPFEVVMLEDHSQSKLADQQEGVDEYDEGV